MPLLNKLTWYALHSVLIGFLLSSFFFPLISFHWRYMLRPHCTNNGSLRPSQIECSSPASLALPLLVYSLAISHFFQKCLLEIAALSVGKFLCCETVAHARYEGFSGFFFLPSCSYLAQFPSSYSLFLKTFFSTPSTESIMDFFFTALGWYFINVSVPRASAVSAISALRQCSNY